MVDEPNTSALVWFDKHAHEYHYIPTDPPARTWRGPYSTEAHMRAAMVRDIGEQPHENYTRVAPALTPRNQQERASRGNRASPSGPASGPS
jgi:hypothetical protein